MDLHWNLAFAFLMFVVLIYFYAQNWLGGGDVKILTVAFLWVGLRCAFPFAVLLLIFSTAHFVAAKFEWVSVRQIEGRQQIPFAPSVAAALIAVFMLGCLQPILLPSRLKGGELLGPSLDEIARHVGNAIPHAFYALPQVSSIEVTYSCFNPQCRSRRLFFCRTFISSFAAMRISLPVA
jgi:type IV leader peptidase family protein